MSNGRQRRSDPRTDARNPLPTFREAGDTGKQGVGHRSVHQQRRERNGGGRQGDSGHGYGEFAGGHALRQRSPGYWVTDAPPSLDGHGRISRPGLSGGATVREVDEEVEREVAADRTPVSPDSPQNQVRGEE